MDQTQAVRKVSCRSRVGWGRIIVRPLRYNQHFCLLRLRPLQLLPRWSLGHGFRVGEVLPERISVAVRLVVRNPVLLAETHLPVLALGRAVGGGGGRRRRTTMGLIARRWQWHTVGKRWCSICMFSPPDIVKQNQRCSALPCRNHLCSEPCATPRQRRGCDGCGPRRSPAR